jgi:hypothetical protein
LGFFSDVVCYIEGRCQHWVPPRLFSSLCRSGVAECAPFFCNLDIPQLPSLRSHSKMSKNSLTAAIEAAGGAVNLLRNSKAGIYVYPVVASEFSNWRSEQMAWRNSAVLFDQTHHMDEITVEGPDSEKFLSYVGINSFANFKTNVAKHFVPVTPAGHVIGDMIIFRETEEKFILVGRAPTANWIRFQASGTCACSTIRAPIRVLTAKPSTVPTTASRSRVRMPTRSLKNCTAARSPK